MYNLATYEDITPRRSADVETIEEAKRLVETWDKEGGKKDGYYILSVEQV